MALPVVVRALHCRDAEDYVALRARAIVEEPLSFSSGPGDDRNASIDFVRQMLGDPGQAVFGALAERGQDGPALVGVVGIRREHHRKRAHRSTLWGLYVAPLHRGRSIGRALINAALSWASTIDGVEYVDLGVGTWNSAALRLYEDLGFVAWGTEHDALRAGDSVVAEHHMTLRLKAPD
jgi:ribosomal protein S18 acetylase RimI-like enzyme